MTLTLKENILPAIYREYEMVMKYIEGKITSSHFCLS